VTVASFFAILRDLSQFPHVLHNLERWFVIFGQSCRILTQYRLDHCAQYLYPGTKALIHVVHMLTGCVDKGSDIQMLCLGAQRKLRIDNGKLKK